MRCSSDQDIFHLDEINKMIEAIALRYKIGCLTRQTSQHKVVLRLILPGLKYLYIHVKDLSPILLKLQQLFPSLSKNVSSRIACRC